MKRLFKWTVLCMTAFLAACSSNSTSIENESENSVEEVTENLTRVNEPGFEMAMHIPDEFKSVGEPEIYFDESVGFLKIRAGEDLGIDIMDQDIKLDEIKMSITNKPLFSYQFTNETESGFTFQSFLPDGKVYSTNFVEKFTIEDKIYYARNSTNGEYSLEKVKKMKEIIRSIKSI